MMILSRIRERYLEEESKVPKGNPTGSRFGKCAAQLQQLLYPGLTNPEPFPPRAKMGLEEGLRIEQWLAGEIAKVMPGAWGLRQQPFYLQVPLDPETARILEERLALPPGTDGRIWGERRDSFVAPQITRLLNAGDERQRYRVRGIGHESEGIILDMTGPCAWLPLYVDGLVDHPTYGPAVVEVKSMSNFAFRRATQGQMSYENLCQMAGALRATGFQSCVWFCYRKETSHLVEVAMTLSHTGRAIVTVALTSGVMERYLVEVPALEDDDEDSAPTLALVQRGDTPLPTPEPTPFPGDRLWDIAGVELAFSEALITEIAERMRKVIRVAPGTWDREYGPSFTCAKCHGSGRVTCGYCKGTGLSKGTGPKPCGAQGCVAGVKTCSGCSGAGSLEQTTLPNYPCGYCAAVRNCWPFARLELTDKPRFLVARADWNAAGVSFTSPRLAR